MDNSSNWIRGYIDFPLPCHMNYGKHFIDRIRNYINQIALIDGVTDERLTFEELALKIVKIATSLTQMGVKSGDVVAISSENRIEVLPTAIAVICTGAVTTFINTAYNKNEVIEVTNISKPNCVIMSPNAYNVHYKTLKKISFIKHFFIYGNERKEKEINLFSKLEDVSVDIDSYEPVHFQGQPTTAFILYSSGTTGSPKGVKIGHLNFISISYQNPESPRQITKLTVAPMSNTIGLVGPIEGLISGKTIVLLSKFIEKQYLQTIEKYKVAILLIPPPIVVTLCKSSILDNYDVSSVEILYCGGAPLELETINEVKTRLPNLLYLLQGYGMTETTGTITKETETERKTGTVGKVQAGATVKIVDTETGKSLGPGLQGELCVKGPILFEEYIGKGRETDEEGFFRSGDIAYYDEEEYFYIVDRIKELIKYKAWQVSPSELEGILLQHPSVKDVGVVGLPDRMAGELPTAFVVTKPNIKVKEKELIDFVASKVSPWKQLRGGVKFVEEIPKNSSGKILRRILRELLIKPPASKL